MGKLYQVVVSGVRGGKVTVDLSNTEEQFKSMTVEQLREKIRQKFPETAGKYTERNETLIIYLVLSHIKCYTR